MERKFQKLPLKATLAAGAVLGTAAAVSACGGESSPKTPDTVANNPTASETIDPGKGGVAGEAAQPGGQSSPIVVETPTVIGASPTEEQGSTLGPDGIPVEFQSIFESIDAIPSISDEILSGTKETFKTRWSQAQNDIDEYDAVKNIVSNLKSIQNQEPDPAIDQQIQNSVEHIRSILASKPEWQQIYNADEQIGYFDLSQ